VPAQAGGTHRYERVIAVYRSNVEVAQPPHGHEELSVVGDLLHIDVRQSTRNRVTNVGVEEQPDDGEFKIGVRQACIAPVQYSGDLATAGVVQDVFRFKVGVNKRARRPSLVAPGLVCAPQHLDAGDRLVAEHSPVPPMQFALTGMSETLVVTDVDPGRSGMLWGDSSQCVDHVRELVEGSGASAS
jgi:hypothetical protein